MDRAKKLASERSEMFKQKSSIVDKRSLRAHRRSIEWKQMRNDTVNQNRRLDRDLSPLKEKPEVKKGIKSRDDMLKKWREEKELKKKLEAKTKHKTFKVAHVKTEVVAFSKPLRTLPKIEAKAPPSRATTKRAPTVPKTPLVARKITVAAAGKRAQQVKKLDIAPKLKLAAGPATNIAPTRRVTRSQTGHPPQQATQTKATKTAANKQPTTKNPVKRTGKPAPAATKKVSTTRKSRAVETSSGEGNDDASFAPAAFKFTAPSELKSFAFKPLSPSSTTQFLLGKSTLDFSPLSSRRCSTPIHPLSSGALAPNVLRSPLVSTIGEIASSESEAAGSGSEKRVNKKKPVFALDSSNPIDSSQDEKSRKTRSKQSRSRGRSAGKSTPVAVSPAGEEEPKESKSKTSRRKSVKATKVSESEETSEEVDEVFTVKEVKSSRKSVGKIEEKADKRKSARKSIAVPEANKVEDIEENSQLKKTGVDLDDEVVKENSKEKSSRRKSVRKSVAVIETEAVGEVKDKSIRRKSVRKSVALVESEVSEVETTEKSSRRKSVRKSIVNTSALKEASEVEEKISQEKSSRKSIVSSGSEEWDAAVSEENVQTKRRSVIAVIGKSKSEGSSPIVPLPVVPDIALMLHTPGSILRNAVGPNRHNRAKSMSVSFTPSATCNNRCSLLLRQLSPEDGLEVLKNSPMIELERKTPKTKTPKRNRKSLGAAIDMPSFEDMEDLPPLILEEVDISQDAVTASSSSGSIIVTPAKISTVQPAESTEQPMETSTEQPAEQANLDKVSDEQVNEVTTTTEYLPAVPEPSTSAATDEEGVHNVAYFRMMVAQESVLLNNLCAKWTIELEGLTDVTEEVLGQIRTVIGKAQLLTGRKGRFTQFIGLVDACEFKTGEKETTEQDLQGFWDMVYFQVEDVYAMFGDLDKLKDFNFKLVKPVVTKKVVKKVIKKKPAAAKTSTKPRGPSKFAAFRAQMKKQEVPTIEEPSAIPSPAKQEATKTFEAGFFQVQSPVRSPAYHCEAGTPTKSLASSREHTPRTGSQGKQRNLLHRAALENSSRKSSRNPSPATTTPSNNDATNGSPSKRQCIEHPTATNAAVAPTAPSSANRSSIFTPDSLNNSRCVASSGKKKRRSVRRSIEYSAQPQKENDEPTTAANDSFTKFLMPRKVSAEEEDELIQDVDGMLELSLSSPAPMVHGRRSSVGRSLSASERRKSRTRRSVLATKSPANTLAAPEDEEAFSALAGFKVQVDEQNNRRVSCFTPPAKLPTPKRSVISALEEEEEEPTVNLMCFSPLKGSKSNVASNNTPTRSRRTRTSIL